MSGIAKKKETEKMARLYRKGWTMKRIAEHYGISTPAVWGRFERAGIVRRSIAKYKDIDQARLEALYRANIPLVQIGATLSVGVKIVKAALDFYRIPKRKLLRPHRTPADFIKALEMAELVRSGLTYSRVGGRYGLSAQIVKRRIKIFAIPDPKLPSYTRVNKERLKKLYAEKALPVREIAATLGFTGATIRRALKFHQIPARPPLGGLYISKMRKLTAGEIITITTRAKYPVINLHTIAKTAGIKISVRRLGGGEFKITRVE